MFANICVKCWMGKKSMELNILTVNNVSGCRLQSDGPAGIKEQMFGQNDSFRAVNFTCLVHFLLMHLK